MNCRHFSSAEEKITTLWQILLNIVKKLRKKKVLATKPAIDNSIPVRFKTEYFLQIKKNPDQIYNYAYD